MSNTQNKTNTTKTNFSMISQSAPITSFKPLSIEISQSKQVKQSNYHQQCISRLHDRKQKTPKQSGRTSPLKQCEKIVQEELEILDECDLEILDILKNNNDPSENDFSNDIIDWDAVEDNEIKGRISICPELMFSL